MLKNAFGKLVTEAQKLNLTQMLDNLEHPCPKTSHNSSLEYTQKVNQKYQSPLS